MRKIKIISQNKFSFNAQGVAKTVLKILKQTGSVSVELSIVSEEEIKRLNGEFRSIDKVTDVLSFPSLDGIRYKNVTVKTHPLDLDEDGNAVFLGSIAICLERAKEQAAEYNHSEEREHCYLFCHGLLHLFGYDHMTEEDDVEMRALASAVMKKLKLKR